MVSWPSHPRSCICRNWTDKGYHVWQQECLDLNCSWCRANLGPHLVRTTRG